MSDNLLYYGDNLDILRRYVADESVDLIYLDPPFKSNQDYNVLFAEQDGSRAAAQIKAFEDTWHWDTAAVSAYQEAVERGGRIAEALRAFYDLLGGNDMLAYLTMMAPRLEELRRVLKPTGSIYLHCDPTASHYLKILMDAIFGHKSYQNEIVWKRTSAHNDPGRWGRVHDSLLFYSRQAESHRWNAVFESYNAAYLAVKYRNRDEHGPYRLGDLTGAGTTQGESSQPWRSYDPTSLGRHWAPPRKVIVAAIGVDAVAEMTTLEKLDWLDSNGFIYWTPRGKKGGAGFPQYKRYLTGGVPIQDMITDIPPINSQAQERLGYPTQKPEALLDRIIQASSNEGDTVLDPFCGCGTTIASAQRLKRRWIGIDITNLAITLIRHRLQDAYGRQIVKKYKVIGEPVSVPDAEALAQQDRYQFQWWALGLVGARPTPIDQKKGADKGIDGRLYFFDDPQTGKPKQIIFSVKSGHLKATDVRDLRGVIDREKAAIGVLIALEEPTRQMRAEAASAGNYESPFAGHKAPRLQILTVEQLLEGKGVDMPPHENIAPFGKKAPKARTRAEADPPLPFGRKDEHDDESE